MKTLFAKKNETEKKWYVVDATDQVLGRMSTQIAKKLTGKDKPTWTPNADTGDFVVVIGPGPSLGCTTPWPRVGLT